MGLDMYLVKKTYVGGKWDFNNVEGIIDITVKGKKLPINLKRVDYINEEVGYWRKANAIHKWFVNNIQGGKDDCKAYYVEIDEMKELLDICKKVAKNCELEVKTFINEDGLEITEKVIKDYSIAEELLPTQKGFFFGSTIYDEWYLEDINNTIEILENVIKEEEELNKKGIYAEFEYSASW